MVVSRRQFRHSASLNRNRFLLLRSISVIVLALLFETFLDQHVRLTGDVARGLAFAKHLVILFASVFITLMLADVLAEIILMADVSVTNSSTSNWYVC